MCQIQQIKKNATTHILSRGDSLDKFQQKHFEITILGIIPFHYMSHLVTYCQAMSLFTCTCHVWIPSLVVMSRNWTNSFGVLQIHTHPYTEGRYMYAKRPDSCRSDSSYWKSRQQHKQRGAIEIIVMVIGDKLFIVSSICPSGIMLERQNTIFINSLCQNCISYEFHGCINFIASIRSLMSFRFVDKHQRTLQISSQKRFVYFSQDKELYYKVQDDYQAWAFVCVTQFLQACFVWPMGSMYVFHDNFCSKFDDTVGNKINPRN